MITWAFKEHSIFKLQHPTHNSSPYLDTIVGHVTHKRNQRSSWRYTFPCYTDCILPSQAGVQLLYLSWICKKCHSNLTAVLLHEAQFWLHDLALSCWNWGFVFDRPSDLDQDLLNCFIHDLFSAKKCLHRPENTGVQNRHAYQILIGSDHN